MKVIDSLYGRFAVLRRRQRNNASKAGKIGRYHAPPGCQVTNLETIFNAFFSNQESGLFVEIGAHDGKETSNTWNLAKNGWRGYYVEPVSEYAERCKLNHSNNSRISTHRIAISDKSGHKMRIEKGNGLSTGKTEVHKEYSNLTWAKRSLTKEFEIVETMTLNLFLQENKVPINFDLLVIDVEGYEIEVFDGFDLEKWSPKIMIVELSDLHPDLIYMRNAMASLYLHILKSGYKVVYKDSINTVFVENLVWSKLYGGLI